MNIKHTKNTLNTMYTYKMVLWGEVWFDAVFNSQKMVLGFVNTNIQNTDIGGGG